MISHTTSGASRLRRWGGRPSLSFVLLSLFLLVLWVAGGASRGDVLGQVVVRGAAWVSLVIIALMGAVPSVGRERTPLVFLMLAIALVLLQLVPLPPSIWQALPGRALLSDAATIAGQAQPWRPVSMVPGATLNALAALVVPFATLVLLSGISDAERSWLKGVLLGLALASALLALLQFSGSGFNNPFINDTPGQISASFANRNHLALFLSFGCVLAPAWAFGGRQEMQWRSFAALGMVLLFVLTIMATGSRAGLLLGVVALVVAPMLVRRDIRRTMRRYPPWALPALIAGIFALILGAVLVAFAADRAISLQRIFAADGVEDMRTRALPTILTMIGIYFPIGSGFGGFDPVFRIHEPMALLKLTYFNHAHNDFLEIVLDGGLAGGLLLLAGILWWVIATIRAWRAGPDAMEARVGSALLGLTLIASAFDYPARTPMILAVIVIASVMMSDRLGLARR